MQFLFICFFSIMVYAQDKIITIYINPKYLPKEIEYKGKVIQSLKWIDKAGENLIVTSETGYFHNQTSKYDDANDAEIYAYHYIIKDRLATQTWQLYDYQKDCDYEVYAGYIKNTFQITDLNKNGIGEVWLVYKLNCYEEMSPYTMKIVMYEGDKRYTLIGKNKVKTIDKGLIGGEFAFDKTFYRAPKEFKDFAKQLWQKNIINTLD
jgi:hypothetical protein